MIEHDPIVLAKQIASLDLLSGGRFVFGVGAGWNKPEMRNHGTDPDTRHGDMRERVEAMKAIWTQDEAEYHGELRRLRPDLAVAEAAASRRSRCYIGGNGPQRRGPRAALRRRLDAEHEGPRRRSAPRVAELRERAGRHVPVTYYGATPENLDALRGGGRRPRADRARVRPRGRGPGLDTLTEVSAEPILRIHQTRSRVQPGRDGRHEGAGRGRAAVPHAQARLVQGPAARQRRSTASCHSTIADEGLHTVCQEAACPNIGDCWDRGTATFMILGDTCTRRCGFCNVKTGKPTWNDPLEPLRVARSRRPHGPAPRGHHVASTATTCPTTARRSGAA